ncbi:MAG: GNAT family N-acetyltransferase [Clostridia bacterium]|nr:GNAT family N-acetyltransferase [Clostridia bacterium]
MKYRNEKFKLVIPTIKYKRKAIKYIKEHHKYNSRINGSGLLYEYLNDYDGWLKKLEYERNIVTDNVLVPSETYFLVRTNDDKIIGMVNLRTDLNERVKNTYGSIGYGVRPKERRKGYNKINLYLILLECKKRGIKSVILSCEKDNIASSKTMLALGAVFDKEIFNNFQKKFVEFYRIDVDYAVNTYKDTYEKYVCQSDE